jgi:hypothetical protein
VIACNLPFPPQFREAKIILILWTNTRSTYHCNRSSFEFIFCESWQDYWPYILGKITGNQPVVQVYRLHNGSPKLVLEMSVVHNYSNVYYVKWQFTWINIYRDCILIIFKKSTQQQGISALWWQFSQHSVGYKIAHLCKLREKRCKMRYKLQLFWKNYYDIRCKNCFILRLYWEDENL